MLTGVTALSNFVETEEGEGGLAADSSEVLNLTGLAVL